MQFECQINIMTGEIKGEEDLQITVKSDKQVDILLKDIRLYNILAMRKQIVAGLNAKLDEMVEQHLGAMALKEAGRNAGVERTNKRTADTTKADLGTAGL